MEYKIEISNFEGPLDLLLHLIKDSEVNICDINIEQVTNQYLDYIKKSSEMNLNIASEYLVMAAELIEIKSSILLPKNKIEIDDNFEEDPREKLINKLLEYEKYKNISLELRKFEEERNCFFTKEPYDLSEYLDNINNVDEDIKVEDLSAALKKMLQRLELEKPLNTKITNKEYSVSERSNEIKEILKKSKQVEFSKLFNIITKDYIVVTFLSVLDLAKKDEIVILQDKNFEEIILEMKDNI